MIESKPTWDPFCDDIAGPSPRGRYLLARAGLGLCALACGLLAIDSLLHALFIAVPDRRLHQAIRGLIANPSWPLWVHTPINWGFFLGALLLWNRWDEPSWRRRSGWLVVVTLVGLGFWAARHGEALFGVPFGHHHLREQTLFVLRWSLFGLLASLAGDVAAHLGRPSALGAKATVFALAGFGLFASGLQFLSQTDWSRGWPLQPAWPTPLSFLLFLIVFGLRTSCGFLLLVLCLAAARECSQLLRDLAQLARAEDLFETHRCRSPREGESWDR